ncbi:MAG TPA: histidinol dehydrogenase [Aliidiomarina sp.]|nr:histidinol dehydrogenase [Aliidiomarina sp.]
MKNKLTTVPTPTIWSQLNADSQSSLLARPAQQENLQLQQQVADIIASVRVGGDTALASYTEKFDGVSSRTITLDATLAESLSSDVITAIDLAYENIRCFHALQQPKNLTTETSQGVVCELKFTPFDAVGLYIPGGTAVLPSTVLMLGVLAQLAGCRERILVTPPNKLGALSPAVAYAAMKCGVTRVVLAGGAQAIAALAFGTETIPAVDKIFGPGNSFVTAAKQQVSQLINGPAIDLPAGPSELLVIADETAEPAFVAADLLSQAEHGADSQVICLSPSLTLLKAIQLQLEQQLQALPRQNIAQQALAKSSLIVTTDLAEAIAISQRYAPEHLSLQIASNKQKAALAQLTNAGSIFVGHYTPESGGDYATGTNHVLPTYGFARNYSSLGLLDFYRRYTVQSMSPKGLANLGQTIMTLAELEQLDAHARAVAVRLNSQRFELDTSASLEGTNND